MMPKRLRACGLPRGPNMRMRLFGWVPVASPSFSKPTVRLDVVAQDRLAGVDIAGEHGVDAFTQQRFAEAWVACDPLLHPLLGTPRQCHLLPPRRGNSVAQAPHCINVTLSHPRFCSCVALVDEYFPRRSRSRWRLRARQPRELSLICGKPSVSHSRLHAKRVP